ncbi:hypothetical protein BJ875DRAFT_228959 [Amylocarpus encephaloides]|uniref:Uncharacterized protein n=1 Tax=Amylocarpus encephaloides TaxID=45428 RepID=A0A9P8BZM1_9HELO|nr:hypothetical protein BJ875DRAFT_228959 [Amylocarpus encephaloides]
MGIRLGGEDILLMCCLSWLLIYYLSLLSAYGHSWLLIYCLSRLLLIYTSWLLVYCISWLLICSLSYCWYAEYCLTRLLICCLSWLAVGMLTLLVVVGMLTHFVVGILSLLVDDIQPLLSLRRLIIVVVSGIPMFCWEEP